jgi:MoaA/NifB/PqqE/SkfB family radical SAM enzyme
MTQRDVTVAAVLLHPRCNMTCTFCVTPDGAFEALSFDEAVDVLDGLAARGVRSVVFGGGEPCAWPGDLVRLARAARERGILVQVGTNGIALPDGFAELDCIDRWVLPLESVDPDVHDALRKHGPGHHALVRARLDALAAAGREVTLSTVVTTRTLDGVAALGRFLRDHHAAGGRVHAWHLYRFLPYGRGGARHRAELEVTAEEYAAACDAALALDLPFRVFRRTNMYRSRNVEFFWRAGGSVRSGQEAPR